MTNHIVTHSLALLLVATTTSQLMPQPSFPYPYQQSPMHMMPMPNSGPMMQPPNGGPMMQMPNAPPMMPHMPRLPGMPPGPMPMPMAFPMHGGRLPMVVTPHRSKKADKRRRKSRKPKRKRINMESSSSEVSCSDCSESLEYRRSNRNKVKSSSRNSKKREVLTPVVSYVTRDGYVVYQKKIKKDKARDWLEMTNGDAHDSRELKDHIRIRDRDN